MNDLIVVRNSSSVAASSGAINFMQSLKMPLSKLIDFNSSSNSDTVMNIISMGDNEYWSDINSSNTFKFVSVHFKRHSVSLNGYALKTHPGSAYIKSWVLEGSNDGKSWELIHEQPAAQKFCTANRIFTFSLNIMTKPYSYFRVSKTGVNCVNELKMYVAGLELYGEITDKYSFCSYRRDNGFNILNCIFFVVVSIF